VTDAAATATTRGSVLAGVLDELSEITAEFTQENSLRIPRSIARNYGWDIDSQTGVAVLTAQLQYQLLGQRTFSRQVIVRSCWAWVEISIQRSANTSPKGLYYIDPKPSAPIATRYQPPAHGGSRLR